MQDGTPKPELSPTNAVQDGTPVAALPPPARRSVWTTREKLVRLAWAVVARPLWILAPGFRPGLIRLFGGEAGRNCAFAASVEITIPWHVRCGDNVRIGERVILYGLGPITIGDGTVIDYRAHLCAGTHDMTDSRFPLLKTPIAVGRGCFIGADAYIGPGVELGDGCRVWPRASIYSAAPAGTHLRGNPGKPFDPASEGGARPARERVEPRPAGAGP
ncbi:MAG TPA: DapH/DapD/GlmU-related protein [Phycisphaerales bacterium]|nr:DapH/DapD/GlmU-related protein [Phycisphaerales bacterium]